MKQVIYNKTGAPEVLEIREAPIPKVKKGEVRVKMLATSVNGGDLLNRRGVWGKESTFRRPKTIGIDIVGTVDAVGEGVNGLKPGDLVWGNCGPSVGTTAEYFVVPAKKIAKAPENVALPDAAALPTAGITSIAAMIDVGKLKAGEHILIRGVGGVGLTAVQIAKANGAHVTALASGKILDGVKSAGADEVYDYRKIAIGELGKFDLIFDTAGTELNELRKHLTKNGRLVTIVVQSFGNIIPSLFKGRHRTRLALGFSTQKRLNYLSQLVSEGKVVPVIDSVYSLEQIADAHRRAEERGILGKVIISISDP